MLRLLKSSRGFFLPYLKSKRLLIFNTKAENSESMLLCQPAPASPTCIADIPASIEISLGNATIRIANGTDLAILDRILSLVKGTGC